MLFCRDIEEDDEEDTSHWLLAKAPAADEEDVATGNENFEDVETGDPATECEFGL